MDLQGQKEALFGQVQRTFLVRLEPLSEPEAFEDAVSRATGALLAAERELGRCWFELPGGPPRELTRPADFDDALRALALVEGPA